MWDGVPLHDGLYFRLSFVYRMFLATHPGVGIAVGNVTNYRLEIGRFEKRVVAAWAVTVHLGVAAEENFVFPVKVLVAVILPGVFDDDPVFRTFQALIHQIP